MGRAVKYSAAALILLSISACSDYRNSPDQQVEDYKKCVEAGMTAVTNVVGEISCFPKRSPQP